MSNGPILPGSWLPGQEPIAARRTIFLLSLFLVPILLVGAITWRTTRLERGLLTESLFRQADALARSVETSSRMGMMSALWDDEEVFSEYLTEMAGQSGALFLAVLDQQGRILASSGDIPGGLPLSVMTPPSGPAPEGFFLPDERMYAYRKSASWPGRGMRGMGMMGRQRTQADGVWTMVLLDAAGPLSLRSRQHRMTLLLAVLLAAAASGILGWVVWSQRAREVSAALARTESLARAIVGRIPAGLLLLDPTGKVVLANAAAAQILGREEDALQGAAAGDLIPPALLRLDDLRSGKELPLTEGKLPLAQDRSRAVSLTATPVRNQEGAISAILLLFQDVSETATLRQRLAQSERLAELGRLAATVAHEVRNPLSSIRGFAQLLSQRPGAGAAEYSQAVVSEVDRLNRVVSGLLTYARPAVADIRVWPVRDILEHVRALAEGDAAARGVEVVLGEVASGLSASLDRDLIIQSLLNLVVNAVEASSGGKKVTLDAQERADSILLTVTDEGQGLVGDSSEELFELFTTSKEGGTGLGLALVRKVAQLHGGTARLLSDGPGLGTRAEILIPQVRAETQ